MMIEDFPLNHELFKIIKSRKNSPHKLHSLSIEEESSE